MDYLRILPRSGNIEFDRTLDAVEIVVKSALRCNEQRSRNASEVQVKRESLGERALYKLDRVLCFTCTEDGFVPLGEDKLFHKVTFRQPYLREIAPLTVLYYITAPPLLQEI